MRLIAIDMSTTSTGVAIFEDGIFKKHFLIKPKRKEPVEKRIEYTVRRVKAIMQAKKPEIVVIEDTYAYKDMKSFKWLTRLQGAVIMSAIDLNIEYHFVLPTSWRKELGFSQGKVGRKKIKEIAKEYVHAKYNIIVNDDEADSICIGEAYLKSLGKESL